MNRPLVKFAHYLAVATLGSGVAVPLLTGHGLNWNTVIFIAGALAVWFTKNTPRQPWARTVTAAYVAGAAVLASAWTDQHISAEEWTQILLALLGTGVVVSAADEIGPNAVQPGREDTVSS